MTRLPRDPRASDASKPSGGSDDVHPNGDDPSEPPLELVLAPRRSDARWRYAYIGASLAAALIIGYLSGSSNGLKGVVGSSVRADRVEQAKALSTLSEATTDASDQQKTARLVDEIKALQAKIEQIQHNTDNLQASERLHALEAGNEQGVEAGKTNRAMTTRLDKLEARLTQLERAALDRTQAASAPKPDRGPVAKPDGDKRTEAKTTTEKGGGPAGVIADYILDHVDGGRAFVIRPDGFIDAIVPGDDLPGAGRVTAIERRGGGWAVTTTQGVVVQRP